MMQHLFFILAGILFGLANVIPGVSGGTMAVVFGVYERLIGILSDPIKGIKKEWKFLIVFGLGAGIGILAFGKLMNWVLERYPAQAAMFFIGVILGSLPMLFRNAFMPGGKGDQKAMLKALKKKKLSRRQLQLNASRVLHMAQKLTGERQACKETVQVV